MLRTRVQLPDLTENAQLSIPSILSVHSTLGGISSLFMFLRPYQVILCSPQGDMVVALKT